LADAFGRRAAARADLDRAIARARESIAEREKYS